MSTQCMGRAVLAQIRPCLVPLRVGEGKFVSEHVWALSFPIFGVCAGILHLSAAGVQWG